MKTTLLSLALAVLTVSASAQVFQPKTARNVLIGGIAGAVIGEHNDRPVEGAVIGAAAGLVWSAATGADRYSYHEPSVPVYTRGRVIVAPPICEPPRRVVVIRPPVLVVPAPPRVIVRDTHRHHHHHHHGYVQDDCRPPRRVVYGYR